MSGGSRSTEFWKCIRSQNVGIREVDSATETLWGVDGIHPVDCSASDHTPDPRCCHSAVYDASRSEVVVVGGGQLNRLIGDMFAYSVAGKTWRACTLDHENGEAFPPLLGHTAVQYNDTLYVYGGRVNGADEWSSFLRAVNLETCRWQYVKERNVPTPRQGHGTVILGDVMWVFFGEHRFYQPRSFLSDVCCVTLPDTPQPGTVLQWEVPVVEGAAAPKGRSGHAVVADDASGVVYLTFGCTAAGGAMLWTPADLRYTAYLSDVWQYDTSHRRWEMLHSGTGLGVPQARAAHSSWKTGMHLYIFGGDVDCPHGGGDSLRYFNDLWRFDIASKVWRAVTVPGDAPSPRSGHISVRIPHLGCLIHGGEMEGDVSSISIRYGARYSSSVFLFASATEDSTFFDISCRNLVSMFFSKTRTEFDAYLQVCPPDIRTRITDLRPAQHGLSGFPLPLEQSRKRPYPFADEERKKKKSASIKGGGR